MRVEGQAADGPDSLAHEPVVVLDVVDQLAVPVVDGGELVHGATAAGGERSSAVSSSLLGLGRQTPKEQLQGQAGWDGAGGGEGGGPGRWPSVPQAENGNLSGCPQVRTQASIPHGTLILHPVFLQKAQRT